MAQILCNSVLWGTEVQVLSLHLLCGSPRIVPLLLHAFIISNTHTTAAFFEGAHGRTRTRKTGRAQNRNGTLNLDFACSPFHNGDCLHQKRPLSNTQAGSSQTSCAGESWQVMPDRLPQVQWPAVIANACKRLRTQRRLNVHENYQSKMAYIYLHFHFLAASWQILTNP